MVILLVFRERVFRLKETAGAEAEAKACAQTKSPDHTGSKQVIDKKYYSSLYARGIHTIMQGVNGTRSYLVLVAL